MVVKTGHSWIHLEKIVHNILISGGLSVGGPQTHITILIDLLLRSGAKITIASASTNWRNFDISALRSSGVRVIVSPFGFGRWKLLGKIYSFLVWPILLRRDYDVLYCIGEGKMHLLASCFIVKNGVKIYHEIVESPKPRSSASMVASNMTMLIANSKSVAEDMGKSFPDIPIKTIPFLTSTRKMARRQNKVHSYNFLIRIAFLGRIVHHKRPDVLIDNWPILCNDPHFLPARLDLYGGDYGTPLITPLTEKINNMGLEKQICLHGDYHVNALNEILGRTDLVVLPSEFEGLPLVLVEAMLRGIPIVATSAGGCKELGNNNPDVIITEGTSWEMFASGLVTMVKMLRNGEINSQRLQKWTEERYGYDSVSEKWKSILVS